MSELKITIGQLKNYLGTGLKVQVTYEDESVRLIDLTPSQFHLIFEDYHFDPKPFMYRLSDLDKLIPELGFVPLNKLELDSHDIVFCHKTGFIKCFPHKGNEWFYPDDVYNNIFQQLFQWHFWPFGDEYFEAGLVIDKLLHNTTTH